ncbi:MAG: response regulator [candidate division Zixibacteria bacterium]|nr:response regulator [candidate division Zixibacteria bacterium]MCI0595891.1 response regulator [candidate division Zixibacteria bacterium]
MDKTKILLIDDQLLFISQISSRLAALGLEVEAQRPNNNGLLEKAAQSSLVLINLGFAGERALELVRTMRKGLPHLPIVGYCGHEEKEMMASGLEAGATTVVPNSQISLNPKKAISPFVSVG